ncbi:hypothetical protein JSQ81_15890 [Sporosarcina sp. Marseille-Q4063]|uniref:hypothetical protein n=1 Tax=Sporosarcina sp. Marseille-Q4063 TaxID=2810514 RepID=UPI001BB0984B|nr:hypothetical protein [Sporosarcina sp. Marseille-Q4063]QUW21272.1 hypothetical protein JSQ81_15890 [Sporosarcina sp. Marseille-Q4063]
MDYKLEDVFGVRQEPVESYYSRPQVDEEFKNLLETDKHIVVYGASKQGKSSLIYKHLSKGTYLTVGCGINSQAEDIYKSILRNLDIRVETFREDVKGSNGELSVKTSLRAIIPFMGEAKSGLSGKLGNQAEEKVTTKFIEYNLDIAQDVSDLFREIQFDRFIVLENFHYLDDEVQRRLSYDLRLFQENNLRFIILGIWKERNRLMQYNRDLLDRIAELPVEPWKDRDFEHVINKGLSLLGYSFSEDIKKQIIEMSFGNIGIVQELCKATCSFAIQLPNFGGDINDQEVLEKAIELKTNDYTSSHLKSLIYIASSHNTSAALHLSYYLIKVIVNSDYEDLKNGISRMKIHTSIKAIHHNPENVRAGDITSLLQGLAAKQLKFQITPPILDYDLSSSTLRIIDSTLMFFINYMDKVKILEEIPNPTE